MGKDHSENFRNTFTGVVSLLEKRSTLVFVSFFTVTLLLTIPLVAIPPNEQASQDPPAQVVDIQREIDERFQAVVHRVPVIVESRSGDMLTQAPLWELFQNTQELRRVDRSGDLAPEGLPPNAYIVGNSDTSAMQSVSGVTSIADAIQQVFLDSPLVGITLETASDDLVKQAIQHLLSSPETAGLRELLSIEATEEKRMVFGREIDYWTSPALGVNVLADNEQLGGGTFTIGVGGDDNILNKERFNRNVQDVLRGDEENYRLWGIAIDVNLESEDEGQTAGMFIMFTVVGAIFIVGVSLKSYWAAALTGVGLGILMIWLKGISNLIGIEGGLVIELIVPIAMVSLGVDFAVHTIRRYQETRRAGFEPRKALNVGLAGVMGALVLAMLSDAIAFLSNTSSNIEQVIHFGIAASVAVVSSFVVLGVIVPLALMQIEALAGDNRTVSSSTSRILKLLGIVSAAVLSGAGVIILVAVNVFIGLAIILGMVCGLIIVPAWIAHRHRIHSVFEPEHSQATTKTNEDFRRQISLENWVVWLTRHTRSVLIVTTVITVIAAVLSQRLEPTFDVKDFFDNSSDFVISLDKADEHIGIREGEPAIIYIKGDLANSQVLASIQAFLEISGDNAYLAKDIEGNLFAGATLLDSLRELAGDEAVLTEVERVTGMEITDFDGDGIPDSNEQLRTAYGFMLNNWGQADKAREVLSYNADVEGENVTIIRVGIPASREQANVAAARVILEKDLEILRSSPSISLAVITGSPFIREAQLDATTQTLRKSLPISAAAIFLLLILTIRSVRYAVVTIIPVGLVVAWLYGFMYIAGFSLNFVTATIGAVSIGVGIDYSIHMTERFREELSNGPNKTQAIRRAISGTGIALSASAASSILGFAIMAFAPMPLFASYGVLTAVMVFFALAASLTVLPSLLILVTPEKESIARSSQS